MERVFKMRSVIHLAGVFLFLLHGQSTSAQNYVFGWGSSTDGRLGSNTWLPKQTVAGNDWQFLAGGVNRSHAIKTDGSLWAWGINYYGQLGDGTTIDKHSPVQVGADLDWDYITSGWQFSLALKSDGSLWAWGRNEYGQLGDGTTTDNNSPIQIGTATDWQAIAVGDDHALAIKTDGSLWAWGDNSIGQLGDGTTINKSVPTQIGSGTDWAIIAAGTDYTLAIKTDGSLWAWGWNNHGQLGDGTTTYRISPVQIGTATDWQTVAGASGHTLAIKTDGSLWAWGRNDIGAVGDGTGIDQYTPVQIGTSTDWHAIAPEGLFSCAIKSDGSLWAWGSNNQGQHGDGTTTTRFSPIQIGTDLDWHAIAGGDYHMLALKTDGSLWAWGNNQCGEQGDGTTDKKTLPIQIGTDSDWNIIDAGGDFTLGLKNDGSLWGCGANRYGQLGDGTTERNGTLTQIGVAIDWQAIAASNQHSLAIKTDGSLWAWGNNNYGQLGNGTTDASTSPVQVGTGTDWQIIASSYGHNLALKSDGSLWAWGHNNSGQLGDGTNNDRSTAVQIGTDTDWQSIAAGDQFSLALKNDGSLWAWGNNSYGQLGDGTTTKKYSPAQIGIDTDWGMIAAGNNHSLAIKNDGSLWTWGHNSMGQLGDGTTTNKNSPAQLGVATDWQTVTGGEKFSMAIKTNGSLWAWGDNIYGQLGDGTTIAKQSPVQVGPASLWTSVSPGKWHTLALTGCSNPDNGGMIGSDQLIASGDVPDPFIHISHPTNYLGELEYQWQLSTSSPTFVDISGAISSTYTHIGTITQTTWFRRLAKVVCQTSWVPSNELEVSVQSNSLSGVVSYYRYNAPNTPLPGVVVKLLNAGGDVIGTSTTTVDGEYTFSDLTALQNTVALEISTEMPHNGMSAIGSLAIQRTALSLPVIYWTPVYFLDHIGNVYRGINPENLVQGPPLNVIDAAFAQNRNMNPSFYFDAGDWAFHSPEDEVIFENTDSNTARRSFTFQSTNQTHDIEARTFGDVRGIYVMQPTKSMITIQTEGTIEVPAGEVFTLPVILKGDLILNAMNLDLWYDSEKIEVIDLTSVLPGFNFSIGEESVRVIWSSISATILQKEQQLITLSLRTLKEVDENDIVFQQNNTTEFGDAMAMVIPDVEIAMNKISTVVTGLITNNSTTIKHSLWPNPFKSQAVLQYILPQNGNVSVSILNQFGQVVKIISENYQKAGSHNISISNNDFVTDGTYYYHILSESKTKTYKVSGKILVFK